MARKKKGTSEPVLQPTAEPVLVVQPKSRGRRYVEIAVWSIMIFWLYFYFRFYIVEFIGTLLSPSFQAPLKHVPDYSLGFLPRILSGQLLTFFTGGSMTGKAAGAYFVTGYVITYGLLSLILGMLIEKAISSKNYLMAMFPLLIVFTVKSVWIRFISYEHLDTLMFLFTLAAFFLIKNEKLMWLAPVCVCLGIMTNESYFLLFFPLVFAMSYFQFIKGGMKKTRLYNLIATTVSSFALEVYMLWIPIHSELVSKYSYAEAIAYLEGKAGRAITNKIEDLYVIGGILGRILDGRKIAPIRVNAWSPVDYFHPKFYVYALLICTPILIFTFAIWWKHLKGEKSFWKKSPYILFMLAPLIIFPAFLFFMDMDRLVSAVLFTQVLLLAFVFFSDGQNEVFMHLKEISMGKHRWLLYAAVLLGVIVPLLMFRGYHWLDPPFILAALENMAA